MTLSSQSATVAKAGCGPRGCRRLTVNAEDGGGEVFQKAGFWGPYTMLV